MIGLMIQVQSLEQVRSGPNYDAKIRLIISLRPDIELPGDEKHYFHLSF